MPFLGLYSKGEVTKLLKRSKDNLTLDFSTLLSNMKTELTDKVNAGAIDKHTDGVITSIIDDAIDKINSYEGK